MKKGRKKRSKSRKRPAAEKQGKSSSESADIRWDEPADGKIDHGGFPDIDLKKNLGCG